MKISFKNLHWYIFILIYLIIFFFSGVVQFFIGIPYVMISALLIALLGLVMLIYAPKWNFAKGDLVVLCGFIYIFWIILSGVINRSDWLHILLYLFFPLFPLLLYIFIKSGIREKAFYQLQISRIAMYTACIQFPFVLGQRLTYNFMKGFNRSGQELIEADFWFGTFPMKADHALGFFMLLNILNIYWNNDKLKLTRYPWPVMIWIALTVFITDTKITQLIIALLFILHAYMVVPRKIRILGVISVALTALVAVFFLRQIPILKYEYEYAQKAYTLEHSKWTYNSGIYARRPNIVIYYMYFRPLTLIGEGPYDYFNFKEGKFKKTHHFSQLIWTYNDLGMVGLIIVILFMFLLVKSLALSRWRMWLVFIVLMIYAFMTIALFDFALIMALLLIVNQKLPNELDTDSVS